MATGRRNSGKLAAAGPVLIKHKPLILTRESTESALFSGATAYQSGVHYFA
jgi:hypothetical protein